MKSTNKESVSIWKSVRLGAAILLVFVVYAYGFEITKVNLEELRSPQRQESLVRVTRALFQPDLFAYEQDEFVVNTPIYVPCPEGGSVPAPIPEDRSAPYLVFSPGCANPGDTIQVEGFNFYTNAEGALRFIPGNDPTTKLALGNQNAKTDEDGRFVAALTIPDRQSPEPQFVRATLRRNTGLPKLTETAYDTWEKIVETVFLALLATTLGTILAIPLSFIAARNLMKSVKSPLGSISLSILGWPAGILGGFFVVRLVGDFSAPLAENIYVSLLGGAIAPVAAILAARWALPEVETQTPGVPLRLARLATLLLAALAGFFGLYQVAGLMANLGVIIGDKLGSLAFLGNFMVQAGDIISTITPVVGSLAVGGVVSSFFSRLGQRGTEKLAKPQVKLMNLALATAAGAVLLGLLGQAIEWLYQIDRPDITLWGMSLVGAAAGALLALFTEAKSALPIGLAVYSVTRTILNTLRSIEALVMAIVFVIAVGIGPFAGVMALGLHTIVSLAKLYSEQVESILPGPLEAIEATGANRLQTIVYAVIPQIIPPYISYTMYRWDINVRMSTIIGFVGGGGIGFLLQQNINLLNYRAASAQMLAIAIVVATMDYISSTLRERYV
jgi:phosphonate ABC transporter permease subunit PhnE